MSIRRTRVRIPSHPQMFHYLYCIENLVNGKLYVGKHTTTNLDDGYLGSGDLIKAACAKHGTHNFVKHILCFCSSSEEALQLEQAIVDKEFVADSNTYNLVTGGRGAFSYECSSRGGKSTWANPSWRELHRKLSSERMKRHHQDGRVKPPSWIGRQHHDVTKRKISEANKLSQLGVRNSQFGKTWIFHEERQECRLVNVHELDQHVASGWRKGRKLKW